MHLFDILTLFFLFSFFVQYNFLSFIRRSKWDLSKVKTMHATFACATSFNRGLYLEIENEVTDMYWMFKGAKLFNSDMYVFQNCQYFYSYTFVIQCTYYRFFFSAIVFFFCLQFKMASFKSHKHDSNVSIRYCF